MGAAHLLAGPADGRPLPHRCPALLALVALEVSQSVLRCYGRRSLPAVALSGRALPARCSAALLLALLSPCLRGQQQQHQRGREPEGGCSASVREGLRSAPSAPRRYGPLSQLPSAMHAQTHARIHVYTTGNCMRQE